MKILKEDKIEVTDDVDIWSKAKILCKSAKNGGIFIFLELGFIWSKTYKKYILYTFEKVETYLLHT